MDLAEFVRSGLNGHAAAGVKVGYQCREFADIGTQIEDSATGIRWSRNCDVNINEAHPCILRFTTSFTARPNER